MNLDSDWGCSSVVEHLPSMHEALGTISSIGGKNLNLRCEQFKTCKI